MVAARRHVRWRPEAASLPGTGESAQHALDRISSQGACYEACHAHAFVGYKEGYPEGYQYSHFCEIYRRWAGKLDIGGNDLPRSKKPIRFQKLHYFVISH